MTNPGNKGPKAVKGGNRSLPFSGGSPNPHFLGGHKPHQQFGSLIRHLRDPNQIIGSLMETIHQVLSAQNPLPSACPAPDPTGRHVPSSGLPGLPNRFTTKMSKPKRRTSPGARRKPKSRKDPGRSECLVTAREQAALSLWKAGKARRTNTHTHTHYA